MGRGTCSTMCLTFVMRIERSLLKNASGASKFFFTAWLSSIMTDGFFVYKPLNLSSFLCSPT
eukprot:1144307-Pelagomonas_calceolata.AAC.1